jgi:hypothetical protein
MTDKDYLQGLADQCNENAAESVDHERAAAYLTACNVLRRASNRAKSYKQVDGCETYVIPPTRMVTHG